MIEFERKWRLKKKPDKVEIISKRRRIKQVYLNLYRPEVRLRRSEYPYAKDVEEVVIIHRMTIKRGELPNRTEKEFHIQEEMFKDVWDSSLSKVEKERRLYKIKPDLELEVDEFENGLLIGEIEFESESKRAKNYPKPECAEEEVTGIPHYRNSYIAQYGPPNPKGIDEKYLNQS